MAEAAAANQGLPVAEAAAAQAAAALRAGEEEHACLMARKAEVVAAQAGARGVQEEWGRLLGKGGAVAEALRKQG